MNLTDMEFNGSTYTLRLPARVCPSQCGAISAESLEDPVAAVAAALVEPAGYPPIDQSVFPGDCVAIAVEDDVMQAPAIVAGVVQSLLSAGISPDGISIVHQSSESASQELDSYLPDSIKREVAMIAHNAANRSDLAYVAALRERFAVYVNRILVDADLVISVGCGRHEKAFDYLGNASGVFPAFADEATKRRFWSPRSVMTAVHRRRRQEEAKEAAWLLGSQISVQVVPGANGEILQLVAGEPRQVGERIGESLRHAWTFPMPRRSSLVVAAVEGDGKQQSWRNIARALSASSRVVDEDGAIVVCSNLSTPPGPALWKLAGSRSLASAETELNRERTPDAIPASILLDVMQRAKVYLLSQLDDEIVEELGMVPVSDARLVERIVSRHGSCALLSNAQFAIPYVEGDGVH